MIEEDVVIEEQEEEVDSTSDDLSDNDINEVTDGNAVLVSTKIAGRSLLLETGTLAKQANAAIVARYGDTMILATVVAADKPKEGIDFFPLTVNYEAKLYSAGKIPGGFFKREGRPTENSILACRLIDRPIRPLFPKGFKNEVQIVVFVLSRDENEPDIIGLIAASAALGISDIPFAGPVGAVRIGYINNELIINPTSEQIIESKLDLVVSGTKDAITMVEGNCDELPEELLIEALDKAHEVIKEIVRLQEHLIAKIGKPKGEYPLFEYNKTIESLMREHITPELKEAMQIVKKQERLDALDKLTPEVIMPFVEKIEDEEERETVLEILNDGKSIDFKVILKMLKEEELRWLVLEENKRPDGREPDQIRPLDVKVGILPRSHGSGLFTRGETQVLSVLTLGTVSEVQIIDDLRLEESKRFMHHYNFLPFCVGEVGFMRGPGRREIGHGALAERALEFMVPNQDDFPYTVRLVSEVLESNGSSSMASVCGSTLALMDGGVPIKAPVAGIAMGMISSEEKAVILTDIQGYEDAFGDMDFKVAGTRDGITALQMDIKVQGVSGELLKEALEKAKKARFYILDTIEAEMPAPRKDLSPYAPRVITITVHPDKIREIIGPGGKMINKIIAETGVAIDLEDDGRVFISSPDSDAGEKAKAIIEELVRDVVVGEVYKGKVVKLTSFGAFVEMAPGKEGLVHISKLSSRKSDRPEDILKVGQDFEVRVAEIDYQGKVNLDPKEPMVKKAPYSRPRRDNRDGRDRDNRGGWDRGRGRGDRDRDRDKDRDRGRGRSVYSNSREDRMGITRDRYR